MFSFVRPEHPFHGELERLRSFVAEREACGDLGGRAQRAGATTHAEIKGVRDADRRWRLDRCYWSLQHADPAQAVPFRAHTLHHRGGGEPQLHEFPADPYLRTMADYFSGARAAGTMDGVSVLRYVPLRRLTFSVRLRGEARPVIGKLKRPSKVRESHDRLAAVHHAIRAAGATFAVAAPLGIDETAAVFYQDLMAGADLAGALTVENHRDLMTHVGAVHAELHALPVEGVCLSTAPADRDGLHHDVDWIAFLAADAESVVRRVGDVLARRAPRARPERVRLCHGDFVPSQLLVGGGRTVVTDLDLCHLGDPVREMGALLACLKYDVPLFRQAFETSDDAGAALLRDAEACYLEGYVQRAGIRVDARDLLWFRTCAEVHYLALMLTKDWWRPELFRRALRVVDTLGAELGG